MESFFSRYRNLIVLLAVLLGQVIGLAVQVSKPAVPVNGPIGKAGGAETKDGRNVRVIRLWAAGMVLPFERALHGSGEGIRGFWAQYVDLRHTRDENKQL